MSDLINSIHFDASSTSKLPSEAADEKDVVEEEEKVSSLADEHEKFEQTVLSRYPRVPR